jgi:methionyl-tRNA formyltransferase
MRLIFCGSGSFAAPSLRAVVEAGHEVAMVVTQPPRPAGRGGHMRPTPLGQDARQLALPVMEVRSINAEDSVAAIGELKPQALCVVDFGQLVRQEVRDLAPLGAFNLHGSLLPELRGAAPVNWAIIRGHGRTGVTTFSLADRMDAGPIYLQEALDIDPAETADQLRQRLAEMGAGVVCRTLQMLSSGSAAPQPQDDSKATSAPKLTKADGRLDFRDDAVSIRNRIHGAWSWPGGQCVFLGRSGRRVPVILAHAGVDPGDSHLEPGAVDAQGLAATGRGRLRIEQLQPAGRRLMAWRDFVNGYRVGEGDRFVRIEATGDELDGA